MICKYCQGEHISGTCVVYDFPDQFGRLQLRKVRWSVKNGRRDKCFKMQSRRPLTDEERKQSRTKNHYGIWVPGIDRCPKAKGLLYGLPGLLQGMADGVKAIFWTEGEKDRDSLANKAGVVAISHWQGAENATWEQAAWLAPFTGTVVIAADWDLPGAADALRRYRLLSDYGISPGRLRIVRPASRFPFREWRDKGRDVTDHLEDGFTVEELVDIRPDDSRLRAASEQWEKERGERQGDGDGFGYH
jgi:hypothetical protein